MIEVHVSGTLRHGDYEKFIPRVELRIQQHGPILLLVVMHDFHGWQPQAIWDDVKFDFRHYKDIRRIAMVGERKWQEWMSHFCKPFTAASIRYFDQHNLEEARKWLKGE